MKPVVFIHTNHKQRLGALVSAHSFRRNARDAAAFDVRLLEAKDFPELQDAAGRTFRRGGHPRRWDPDDLQSFTPLRFAVPDVMGHQGAALVVDPDVFAVADVAELFARGLGGKAIWCRARPGHNDSPDYLATSVMLLDCGALPHWRFADQLAALWDGTLDYVDWIELRGEDRAAIGLLEPEWNDFDRLTPATRLLHTTKRRTQPWKTGLPIDYTLREGGIAGLTIPIRRLFTPRYRPHPDANQESYFYALLAEGIDQGSIERTEIEREMELGHVRPDSLRLVDRYRGHLWPAELAAPRAA
ncbi:MAG TPA: hypothetical protein VJR87_08260 [Allosphingosinicella sp.]|nr:hypothetical protein [Allosphingosinicella sp.]